MIRFYNIHSVSAEPTNPVCIMNSRQGLVESLTKEVTELNDQKRFHRIVGAAIGAGLGTAIGGPLGALIGTAVGHWVADQW